MGWDARLSRSMSVFVVVNYCSISDEKLSECSLFWSKFSVVGYFVVYHLLLSSNSFMNRTVRPFFLPFLVELMNGRL